MNIKRSHIILLIVVVGIVLLWIRIFGDQPQDVAYVHQVKQEILMLARDNDATSQRVAIIQTGIKRRWTDRRVGVTADGYVYYYDIHESHGADNIRDVHILYLPDEKRFLISHIPHFCIDFLSLGERVKNKDTLKKIFNYGFF